MIKKIMKLYREGLNHREIANETRQTDKKVVETILKEKRMK